MDKIILITTPLYYVNADPHIGHAYTQVAADTLARYWRQRGREVHLLTGTDEHGEKILRAARQINKDVKEFVDEGAEKFKKLWEKLNINYDQFIRTTDKIHIDTVNKVLYTLYEKGLIYKGDYSGLYCVPCETFFTPSQAEENLCPDCGRELESLSQESYFFKLSAFKDKLLRHIEENPDFIMPGSRKNEIKGFLAGELKDLSISRLDVEWGIKLPFDSRHTVYVWVDALLNYISAPGYLNEQQCFRDLWPADMQLLGKDIIKFHAVIWPAMLMALNLPLPGTVFAHGWWTSEGKKMSKSLGNVVDPAQAADEWGVDALRYYLLRQVTFGQDGDFSKSRFKERYDTELANELGNLLSRVLSMIEKYRPNASSVSPEGLDLTVEAALGNLDKLYRKADFSAILDIIWDLIKKANSYVEQSKPWILAKEDPGKLGCVLANLFRVLRAVGWLIYPFMPSASGQVFEQLGISPACVDDIKWNKEISFNSINKGEPLFPKK